MFRKRRQPAPNFRIPGQPFNPITGQHASQGPIPGKGTTLALFQVVAEDTHDNYVECRGYEADNDPEFRYLHDPYTVPATTPINVAKPYSLRGTFPYELGQVVVAARIKGRLGYNQGKASTSTGQPADLDEEVELLLDDDDKSISWLDVSPSPQPEQSLFLWDIQTIGIDTTEVTMSGLQTYEGKLDGTTTAAVGLQPVTNWVKLFRADQAQRLYFNASGEVRKEASLAGAATLGVSIKRFSSTDVLVQEVVRVVSLTSASASDFVNLAFQYCLVMDAGDYLVATVAKSGAYASTLRLSNFAMYFRPIREN